MALFVGLLLYASVIAHNTRDQTYGIGITVSATDINGLEINTVNSALALISGAWVHGSFRIPSADSMLLTTAASRDNAASIENAPAPLTINRTASAMTSRWYSMP